MASNNGTPMEPNEMSLDAESVTQPGSGLVFANTYGAGVTDDFRAAIIAAEAILQSHFTNAVTVNMTFDVRDLPAGLSAQNEYALVGVSYNDLRAALTAHATSADDLTAAAGLPASDPSHGVGFWIPSAQARVLGLSSEAKATDDAVIFNIHQAFTFGADAVATLEHEITEGVFGRVSSLGLSLEGWQPLDLFRFSTDGQHDYTGGADGQTAVYGLDGAHLSTMEFHNSIGPTGASDGFDLADWNTGADAFGSGGAGVAGALSAADLQVLDILGWTQAPPPPPPAATLGGAIHLAAEAPDVSQMTHAMSIFSSTWMFDA